MLLMKFRTLDIDPKSGCWEWYCVVLAHSRYSGTFSISSHSLMFTRLSAKPQTDTHPQNTHPLVCTSAPPTAVLLDVSLQVMMQGHIWKPETCLLHSGTGENVWKFYMGSGHVNGRPTLGLPSLGIPSDRHPIILASAYLVLALGQSKEKK